MSTSDASRSNTTGPVPAVADDRRHTWPRASATASHKPANVAASTDRTVRYNVESDATDPNSAGWDRSRSMSEHASPPPANINMACTKTLPRSWDGNRVPRDGMRSDSDLPSPTRSANEPNACNPTWATTWSPPPSTITLVTLLAFTSEVPSRDGVLVYRHPQNPLPGGLFRGYAPSDHPNS